MRQLTNPSDSSIGIKVPLWIGFTGHLFQNGPRYVVWRNRAMVSRIWSALSVNTRRYRLGDQFFTRQLADHGLG